MTPTKKILIIEDDIFLGDVLVQKLKAEGYELTLSRDGQEGLKRIFEQKPDLILLDIVLPTKNGYEILEEKQKNSAIAGIPVIIISNSGQPIEISRAKSLGVKDYFVKAQFDPADIVKKVNAQFLKGPAPAAATGISGGSGGTLAGKTVMWVEDDKFLSDIIARKLSGEHCKLLHADDGDHALALLEKEMPDVILLDILLSGIDGFEILRRVKASERTKRIPVILLSNLGQKSDLDKGKELGAVRFLIKATVTLDEIVSEIKTVLAERSGN